MKITRKYKWLGVVSFIVVILILIFLWQFPVYKTLLPGYHSILFSVTKYEHLTNKNTKEVYGLNSLKINSNNKERMAEKMFESHIVSMFPYWYGTRWSYNGTSQLPGKGSIACGYFVTTILQQAGLKIQRNKLAQLGSEQMILSICNNQNVFRYTNYSMIPFLHDVKARGKGIYIIGLDSHTGFIWNDGDEIFFVHASGRFPYCVKREKAIESITLWNSKYKVISKLSSDTSVLKKWLNNEPF